MINYGIARNDQDLKDILQLQQSNLPAQLTDEEARREGFVTVHHDLDLLRQMNSPYPHVIAKANGQLIAYALTMLRNFANHIPVLVPMFGQIDTTVYNNQLLKDSRYFVMGQICIAKGYRGQGIFPGLYAEMKKRMQPHFDYILTEVDQTNQRSLNAHYKTGFQKVKEYQSDDGTVWILLLLVL